MKTVGLFVTCLVDALRPSIGKATLSLLRSTGHRVIFPSTQTCCGQPAFNGGYTKNAYQLAQKVMDEFSDCDAIVMPSGSCCATLRALASQRMSDSNWKCFHDKCFELSQFLDLHAFNPVKTVEMNVSFHDSCSGLRELEIREVPRRLLQQVGVSLIEMHDAQVCCGFGGRFCSQFNDVSLVMADRKCDNLIATGATALVAGDWGCLLHLEGRLRRLKRDVAVFHWAEILAKSLS